MVIKIEDQSLLSNLCGANDQYLDIISQVTGDRIFSYGNEIIIESSEDNREPIYRLLFDQLKSIAKSPIQIDRPLIESIIASIKEGTRLKKTLFIDQALTITPTKKVFPRTINQSQYLMALNKFDLVFGVGPAGTGKTFLAVAYALNQILKKEKRKLLLTRPVVEAGESLGFLPGDLLQKINPYLKPVYDIMDYLIGGEKVAQLEEQRIIEVAPLAYMRGRSLNDSIIILDEAQNTTKTQMKMFLTRLGEGSKAIITGDLSQIDLPHRDKSGLLHALSLLKDIDGIYYSEFSTDDVIRSGLVKKIIKAYENEGI